MENTILLKITNRKMKRKKIHRNMVAHITLENVIFYLLVANNIIIADYVMTKIQIKSVRLIRWILIVSKQSNVMNVNMNKNQNNIVRTVEYSFQSISVIFVFSILVYKKRFIIVMNVNYVDQETKILFFIVNNVIVILI